MNRRLFALILHELEETMSFVEGDKAAFQTKTDGHDERCFECRRSQRRSLSMSGAVK